ncbi:hypothetical protein K7X08_026991 [Anisodus acutangulus]|uniref:Increased DNA methylation 1 C-terminal domain-containing protein n=1 Tax=Anisodus acutangulus TaxID=402998 RepID=A0A9Q1L936_9SOLA|nr:hypothetical protein K7X08_026991 [Anisodus acutangulus]
MIHWCYLLCIAGADRCFCLVEVNIWLSTGGSDGFSWTLLRCIHGDDRVHSVQRFIALKAKLAVSLTVMEECFLPIDMIPHVIYSWGSQFSRLNYHGFYTMILEKDDISVAVASVSYKMLD